MYESVEGRQMPTNEVQPEKAYSWMIVTPSGILIFSSDEQPRKAPSSIDLTVEGSLISLTVVLFRNCP